jgi:phospholipase C
VATTNEIFIPQAGKPYATSVAGPYGLGTRVPMIVVSPWSRGGWVNSQVFDHTSLIKFIEARFVGDYPQIYETNITPWRRAVVGDLTSVFDFKSPNDVKPVRLPSTASYKPQNLVGHAAAAINPPSNQTVPSQEPGVRPARALPYELQADGIAVNGLFSIHFRNTGTATAVFQVRSALGGALPRTYTVEPDRGLTDSMTVVNGAYDLSVYGPNGFFRKFKGELGGGHANLTVRLEYGDDDRGAILLTIENKGSKLAKVDVLDKYSGGRVEQSLEAGESSSRYFDRKRFHNWYDLVVTVDGEAGFEYEYGGHVEDGRDSVSDPMMG